ncbi:MAG: AAA family ATPase, partial [Haloarculaceae archaeon]
MSSGDRSVTLTVQGAQKRDAGRGVARLPEGARRELGVLSGDTVVVEGERPTVAKVWPARDGEGTVRVDADTRANAGVTIGDAVTVRPISVADAAEVRVDVPVSVPDEDLRRTVARDLLDRPLRAGETVRLERLGVRATVTETDPEGTVRVTERTDVSVVGHGAASGEGGESGGRSRAGAAGDAGSGRDGSGTGREAEPDQRTVTGGPPAEEADYGVSYEDIGGLDEELELVREMIELPLTEPDLFARLGIDPPKGVLMHGPPGTGKTLIARAVANEVDAHFEVINGPEIVSKYKGDSEQELRDRFATATANQPAIVFIDELDSIAGVRDDDADMENRLVAQLLTLLDGL